MLPDLGWLGESKRVQTPKKKKKEGRSFRYSPIVTVTTAMFANESYVRLNDESQREREHKAEAGAGAITVLRNRPPEKRTTPKKLARTTTRSRLPNKENDNTKDLRGR